jgi:hypothetical protein
MRIFSSKIIILVTISILIILSGTAQTSGKGRLWKVRYQDAVFTVDQSFPINLNGEADKTLQGRPCIETQWLTMKYYKFTDCPVRLSVMGKDLYGVQFIFADDDSYQIEINLYDLSVHDNTKINELERYFQQHGIDYTKGKDNIATYFATFYYNEDKIGICEFRAVVLKNYGDYFFKRKGETPWWLSKNYQRDAVS